MLLMVLFTWYWVIHSTWWCLEFCMFTDGVLVMHLNDCQKARNLSEADADIPVLTCHCLSLQRGVYLFQYFVHCLSLPTEMKLTSWKYLLSTCCAVTVSLPQAVQYDLVLATALRLVGITTSFYMTPKKRRSTLYRNSVQKYGISCSLLWPHLLRLSKLVEARLAAGYLVYCRRLCRDLSSSCGRYDTTTTCGLRLRLPGYRLYREWKWHHERHTLCCLYFWWSVLVDVFCWWWCSSVHCSFDIFHSLSRREFLVFWKWWCHSTYLLFCWLLIHWKYSSSVSTIDRYIPMLLHWWLLLLSIHLFCCWWVRVRAIVMPMLSISILLLFYIPFILLIPFWCCWNIWSRWHFQADYSRLMSHLPVLHCWWWYLKWWVFRWRCVFGTSRYSLFWLVMVVILFGDAVPALLPVPDTLLPMPAVTAFCYITLRDACSVGIVLSAGRCSAITGCLVPIHLEYTCLFVQITYTTCVSHVTFFVFSARCLPTQCIAFRYIPTVEFVYGYRMSWLLTSVEYGVDLCCCYFLFIFILTIPVLRWVPMIVVDDGGTFSQLPIPFSTFYTICYIVHSLPSHLLPRSLGDPLFSVSCMGMFV